VPLLSKTISGSKAPHTTVCVLKKEIGKNGIAEAAFMKAGCVFKLLQNIR
jgi:hypothetical protein